MVFGRRYRITEKLGAGGMAEVYKAVDEVLGRTVAVKVLHPRYAADQSFAARFRQEAQAAANLQSPNIVNIYDWGQENDTYYIVMEYVRGTDLKKIIEQRGALPSKQVAEICAQVCSALTVAHGYDVIHRDIKPHNIMVGPDGSVKVMDFGIARAGNTTMTQTGSVLGTAHYVSPEQAQGKDLKATSDIYSLGVVMYEAATGQLPFDADTPVAVALKQVNEAPTRPRRINPDIDPGLESIIGKALSKDPNRRYLTAEELRRALQQVARGEAPAAVAGAGALIDAPDHTAVMPAVGGPDEGRPTIRPVPDKRPIWPWIALGIGLIIAGILGAWAMGLLGPQGLSVPDVIGKKQSEAEAIITGAGFKVGDITERFDGAAAGLVVDQSPVANATAEKNTRIDLVISKGPELVEVPTLIGLSEEDAKKALESLGLGAAPLPDEYNSRFDPGKVFQQEPGPGDRVSKGTDVRYIVSRGAESVEVPDVVKKKRGTAVQLLEDAGFKVSVKEEFDAKVAKGVVISQNPEAGLKVEIGSTVDITVSKGPEPEATQVSVPDVVDLPLAQAQATLKSAGFSVTVTYDPSTELSGVVLEQSPAGGTMATKGSTVEILVDAAQP